MPSNGSECTMMKRGTKRKIEITKRDTKQQRSVACSKRRHTVFSKAADLCLLSGANLAVFVTSPAENSDVVYSFSGYSPASEIADCYLTGKSPPKIINPQSKLGFWWEDPDLYRYCDDLSELNIIEDRMMRTKKHLMDCLEKKEKLQHVSNSDQNPSADERFNGGSSSSSQIASGFGQSPSTSSLDLNPKFSSPSSSQITYFHQNCGGSSSQFVSDFNQNPNTSSLDRINGWPSQKIVSFDPNRNTTSRPSSQVTCFDQNPSFSVEDIYGESSSDQSRYLVNEDLGFVDSLWETENNEMSVPQETQTQSMFIEDQSFWENLFKDEDNNIILQVPLPDHSSTNEEDELMIDISDFLSEDEIELSQF